MNKQSNITRSALLSRCVLATLTVGGGASSTNLLAQETLPPVTVIGTPINGPAFPIIGPYGGSPCGHCGPTDYWDGGWYNSGTPFVPPPNHEINCDYLDANWPVGCPRKHAPGPAFVNGCGASSSGWLVPDFHVGNPGTGSIFLGACNNHDICYQTFGGPPRSTCDLRLTQDMVGECALYYPWQDFPPGPWRDQNEEWFLSCAQQAHMYGTSLQTLVGVWSVASNVYDSSRREAACRNAHELAEFMNCPL